MRIDKIWSSSNFLSLDVKSKLTYLHLLTHPELSEFGVVQLNIDISLIQLSLNIKEFRHCTKRLLDDKMVKVIKVGEDLYFIILNYFNKSANSVATKQRLSKKLHLLPDEIRDFLIVETKLDLTVKEKKEPTAEEVEEYAFSCGYDVNGSHFIDYYKSMAEALGHDSGFYDKNGKKVVDWKAKMRNVWFKDSNKLKQVEGTPKEHSGFRVQLDNGTYIYPDYWEDEIPRSKDFGKDIILKKYFETNKTATSSPKVQGTKTESSSRRRR